jgi:hypothetical protein
MYKTLLTEVYSLRQIFIATMASRIVTSIMVGGHAAHSKFKISSWLTDNNMCNFTKKSGTAKLICRASLII